MAIIISGDDQSLVVGTHNKTEPDTDRQTEPVGGSPVLFNSPN